MVEVYKPTVALHQKILIYAPSGHGKTHFLGTAQQDPRTYPMLFVNFEGGDQTLAGLDIDVVRVRDWKDYNEVYAYLSAPGHGYKSVGVDSITETHVFALFKFLEIEVKERQDPDLLQLQDYNRASVQIRRLIRAFRDLPMHVIITGLSKTELEPREGMIIKPALSGTLAEEVPGMMSVVSYLGLAEADDGVHRILVLRNYPKIRTKVRTPWGVEIPNDIIDPTITKLFDVLGVSEAPEEAEPELPVPGDYLPGLEAVKSEQETQ